MTRGTGRYMRANDLVNPDTWQVETVKVDEMSCALCLTDALYLAFTSGKHLFMLEPASVTTAEALTCISPLGGRISMEWWMWWLQQQSGQQQRGQLFSVLAVVRVVAAVLMRAIGRGSGVVERPFCGLVHVGQPCSHRMILPSSSGPFSPPRPWFRMLSGCIETSVSRDEMRTYICGSGSGVAAVAIAVDRETADASRGLKWPGKQ